MDEQKTQRNSHTESVVTKNKHKTFWNNGLVQSFPTSESRILEMNHLGSSKHLLNTRNDQ